MPQGMLVLLLNVAIWYITISSTVTCKTGFTGRYNIFAQLFQERSPITIKSLPSLLHFAAHWRSLTLTLETP